MVTKISELLYRSSASNRYATFFYAHLARDGRTLRYVNAGHNPPYLLRRNGENIEIRELADGGPVVGLLPVVAYDEADVALLPGDLLVSFTDGVTEALNAGGEEFGEDRLQQLLRSSLGAPASEVASRLAGRLRQWAGAAEQHDDLTFIVMTVR
jgi:serine phosphatase RsbU (regulator of sigma subunit)